MLEGHARIEELGEQARQLVIARVEPDKALEALSVWNTGRLSPPFDEETVRVTYEVAQAQVQALEPVEEPDPLTRPLPKQRDYPLEKLGDVLAPAGRMIAQAVQAPHAMCGQSVLAAAALAVQPFADVEIDGRRFPLSCFFVTVGESGERKTEVDAQALRAHREYERDLEADYAREMDVYKAESAAYKTSKDKALKQSQTFEQNRAALLGLGTEPEPPLLPLLTCEEPTLEGLQKALLAGQPSIGLFSDEGGRMIGGHGMNKDNQLKTAAGLSGLWGGKRVSRVRAGDGVASIHGRRLSMHLMVQPSVAQELLSNRQLIDQGLLSRCLVTWPESTAGHRKYRAIDLNKCPELQAYWRHMHDLLRAPKPLAEGSRNELRPRSLTLSPEAKSLWIGFHDYVDGQLVQGGEYASIRGFANKAAEHAARLAGVLTLIDDLSAASIPIGHMASGVELANHYLAESLRLFHAGANDPNLGLAERVLEWAGGRGRHIALPDIYTHGPAPVRNKKTAQAIARILEEHGWFIPVPDGMEINGKHRKVVWEVVR